MTTVFLAAQAAGQGGGDMSFLIMIVAVFAIMWFFMFRPQQKKQKEIRNFQNTVSEGARVITGGGIYGVVRRIDLASNTVEVEIAKGVTIRVDRGYIFSDASSSAAQPQQ
jgi:preprotein translocase subunit YajC